MEVASPTCEIITIGTELLLGQIADTNTTYLAQELGRVGVTVRFRTAVGDHLEEIVETIRSALKRCDWVLTTGGLGPTLDDLTREGAARVAGVKLEFREDLMEQIEGMFRLAGYQMPENNRRQAFVPEGSRAISNPVGTAPGFITDVDGKPIVCLPGVPRELKYLLGREVLPWLRERFNLAGHRISYRVLKTVGVGESKVDRMIGDLIRPGENPEVGLLASMGEIKIRIAAKAGSESEARRLIDPVEKEVRGRLGKIIFGVDEDTLEGVVDRLLGSRRCTLSLLETFTAGLAAERLHRILSAWLLESRVIPDMERMFRWLVRPVFPLDEKSTGSLAERLHEITGADVGLVILGFPKKDGQGYAVDGYAAAMGKGIQKTFSWSMGGDPPTLQQRGAVIGLNTLRLALLDKART